MTDWPDDWFRDGPQGAAANEARTAGEPVAATEVAGAAGGPSEPVTVGLTYPAGSGAPGGTGWPEQPARQTTARPPRFSGWRRWLRPRPILAVLAVLLCLALITAVGGYFYLDSRLTKINALVASPPTAGQNWLITGSTGHLTGKQIRGLHTGYDYDKLSDTILVLHIPANGERPTLVSIPRDSYVPIPGHGNNKINAAYAFGGAQLLVRTVQDITGLHIDHYMGIGYVGLVDVVNALGGVRLCLPGPVVDAKAGIHLAKGCQTLNGKEALGFVRTRQFALGDLQRVQDQRILLKAILSKLTSFGTLINPFSVIPAAIGSTSAITVDQGTGLYQLVHVAFALKNPVTTTVPFGGFATNAAGDVVLWNHSSALVLFHDLATDHPVPRSLITGSRIAPTA